MSQSNNKRGSHAVRARLESGFEAWGHLAYRHPWPLLLVTGLFSAFLIAQLPKLEANTSTDDYLRADDPIRIGYDEFRQRFGYDEKIMLAIETGQIFDPRFLAALRDLHEEIESDVPHVEEVKSLINARVTRGEADELIVEDLFERWPETPDEVEQLRRRAMANPLYENFYFSSDEKVTTVVLEIEAFSSRGQDVDALAGFDDQAGARRGEGGGAEPEFLSSEERAEAVVAVRDIIARHQAPGFHILMAGQPVLIETMNRITRRDASVGLLLGVAAITSLLFILLRRIVAVLLPMLLVLLAMLSTLGMMALAGSPITIASQILPAFLVAVGICDAIHILAIFYRHFDQSGDKEEAIAFTLGHSGLAIVMTTLTTAGGLVSFLAADLEPVASLGIWAPVGVTLALVYTIVLLPALIAIVPMKPGRARKDGEQDRLDRALVALGDFAAARPWTIVIATLAVLVVSLAGTSRLYFAHDPIAWFPEDDELRVSTLFVNDRLGGAMNIELLVDSGAENGLHEPALLNRLEEMRRYSEGLQRGAWSVSKTVSLVDIVKETHQALNENRSEFYAVPQDRRLVAQEFLLFENSGSEDMGDFVDPQFRTARATMRVPWMDSVFYPPILDELGLGLRSVLGPDVGIELTGRLVLLSRTFTATVKSMAKSYLIALAIITPLMIFLIGNVTRGFLGMIPNLTPVIMTLGFMGWVGLPISINSLMLGAIVIGLAVDDTIHFMHNFRRYYDQSGDARWSIHRTMETTGRALLLTSLVLSAGFFTSVSAYLTTTVEFGLLAGCAILVAFLSNVVLASALMVLATRREEARRVAEQATG